MTDDPRSPAGPGPGSPRKPGNVSPVDRRAQRLARDLALMADYPDLSTPIFSAHQSGA